MKFDVFVERVVTLLGTRPETADLDVITSEDDEGNGFTLVHYDPSVGHFDGTDYTTESEDGEDIGILNAVCIN